MLTNIELGNYLKKIREEKNISLREVEKLTDIGYTHLSMIENGKRNVTPALLRNLAKVYNADYIDLYEKAGYLDLAEKERIQENAVNSAVVLVYGKIPAGIPMEMIEDILDTEEISADMLKGGNQYFGLRVDGHSMEPKYLDGDTIILEKVEDCESGQDCVVMVNGWDGTFKKVIKDEENKTITLQPINTSLDEEGKPLYEAKKYTEEEIKKLPVKIIGKVVEIRRKV